MLAMATVGQAVVQLINSNRSKTDSLQNKTKHVWFHSLIKFWAIKLYENVIKTQYPKLNMDSNFQLTFRNYR